MKLFSPKGVDLPRNAWYLLIMNNAQDNHNLNGENKMSEQCTVQYKGQRFSTVIRGSKKVELRRSDLSVFIDASSFKKRICGGLLICKGTELSRCGLV